jgi:hypothetical protein
MKQGRQQHFGQIPVWQHDSGAQGQWTILSVKEGGGDGVGRVREGKEQQSGGVCAF